MRRRASEEEGKRVGGMVESVTNKKEEKTGHSIHLSLTQYGGLRDGARPHQPSPIISLPSSFFIRFDLRLLNKLSRAGEEERVN